jgi:hypothetical protein
LPEKQAASIRSQDWAKHRITLRDKKPICGSKLLCLLNRFGQVYYAERININRSDHAIFKDSAYYSSKVPGILLADRGFNNKIVRDRLGALPHTRFISPPHYKTKQVLSPKESKLYKRRWRIETLFQVLKDTYGDFKLNLKSALTTKLNEAKLFATLTTYNLSL